MAINTKEINLGKNYLTTWISEIMKFTPVVMLGYLAIIFSFKCPKQMIDKNAICTCDRGKAAPKPKPASEPKPVKLNQPKPRPKPEAGESETSSSRNDTGMSS